MIRVSELTKDYGSRRAINEISFEARQGEILGFLGPNGADKTTTMRILSGYMPPTSGTSEVLYSPDAGPVNGIRIEDAKGRGVRLRRGAAGTWSLLQPEIATADPSLEESAAAQAADLRILVMLEQPVSPAVVGLDVPAYTLILETAGGSKVLSDRWAYGDRQRLLHLDAGGEDRRGPEIRHRRADKPARLSAVCTDANAFARSEPHISGTGHAMTHLLRKGLEIHSEKEYSD